MPDYFGASSPEESKAIANVSFPLFLKWLVYLCRLSGIAPVSFSSSVPEQVEVTLVWTIYSVSLCGVTMVTSYFVPETVNLSTPGNISEIVVRITYMIQSVTFVIGQMIFIFYRRDIAREINSLMTCEISKIKKKKMAFLCGFQFCLIAVYCLVPGLRFVLNLKAGYDLFFVWSRLGWDCMAISLMSVDFLFMAFAGILSEKLETLSHEIRYKHLTIWREPFTKQYLATWEHAEALNGIFGIPILFSTLRAFLGMTGMLFFMISNEFGDLWSKIMAILVFGTGLHLTFLMGACDATTKAVSADPGRNYGDGILPLPPPLKCW